MNSWSMVRANIRQTIIRFKALFVALIVGTALLAAAAAVVGGAVGKTANELDTKSALSVLELSTTGPAGNPEPVTQQALDRIRTMPNVEDVVGVSSVGSVLSYVSGGGERARDAAEGGFSGVFWALPRFAPAQPPIVKTAGSWDGGAELPEGGVVLPNTYLGADLTTLVGASLKMESTQATGPGEGTATYRDLVVVGIYDNQSPLRDGESAIYLRDSDYSAVLAAQLGAPGGKVPSGTAYMTGLVKATSVANASELATRLTAEGFYIMTPATAESLPRAISALRKVNVAIALLLAAFAIGIGTTLGSTWSRLRRWDVGVLTSLGWSRRDVSRAYLLELLVVGLLVGCTGAVTGVLLSLVAGPLLVGVADLGLDLSGGPVVPPVGWLLGLAVCVPLSFALGATLRIIRLATTPPDLALRRTE